MSISDKEPKSTPKKKKGSSKHQKPHFTDFLRLIAGSPVLSVIQKAVILILLIYFRNHNGACFPSVPKFCKIAGIHRHTFLKIRTHFTEIGLITYQKGKGGPISARYGFPYLDGTDEDREHIKQVLSGHLTSPTNGLVKTVQGNPDTSPKNGHQPVHNMDSEQRTINNIKPTSRKNGSKTDDDDDSKLSTIKPEIRKTLIKWGITKETITELEDKKYSPDINTVISSFIDYINKRKQDIQKPKSYFMTMIQNQDKHGGITQVKKQEAKPKLHAEIIEDSQAIDKKYKEMKQNQVTPEQRRKHIQEIKKAITKK